jgi:PAS domain S-box-containing protein
MRSEAIEATIEKTAIDRSRAPDTADGDTELRSREIVDSIPGMIAVHTAAGELEFVNNQALEFYGKPLEVLKHWDSGNVIHPDDIGRSVEVFNRSMATGEPYVIEQRCLRADGVYRWLESRASPQRDASGKIVRWYNLLIDIDDRKRAEDALRAREHELKQAQRLTLTDITERKRAEADLRRAYDHLGKMSAELEHVSRVTALGALAASIAHEVNQPLSGIITNAGTCLRLLNAGQPDIERARQTAQRTIRDANRATNVIGRLRALFSKRESKQEPLDLNEAAREVIALSASDLQKHRILVQSELGAHLPRVRGDRIQIQQVILNLLRNASDAMAEVHDRPRHLLIKTAREHGDRVRLTVRDAGVGLSPQSASSLFDPFYTTKSGGMGIGLFVSRSIVERHQGRLWAEPSDAGPGAMFTFSIPCGSERTQDAAE